MDLIERYIFAVTKRLPSSQREEVAEKLRLEIHNMLEERGEDGEDDVAMVLQELGHPVLVADKYRGYQRYLIGPDLFDLYLTIVKIMLSAILLAQTIVFFIDMIKDPYMSVDGFIDYLIALFTTATSGFALVTIGFAIGEYYGGKSTYVKRDIYGKWRPEKLPPKPTSKKKIKWGEPTASLFFTILIMLLFIFKSDLFGVYHFQGREYISTVSFLNDESLDQHLPLIILIFGLGIFKDCLKLIIGKWTIILAAFNLVLNAITIGVVLIIATGPAFWNPNFMLELTQTEIVSSGSKGFDGISMVWDIARVCIFIFFIFGLVIDTIVGFIKAIRQ